MEPPEYAQLKAKIGKGTRRLGADFFLMFCVMATSAICFCVGGLVDGSKAGSVWVVGPGAILGAIAGMVLGVIGFGVYEVLATAKRRATERRMRGQPTTRRPPGSSNIRADITDVEGP